MKYGLFIFPIIIFLFNYRLFSQYLFYWMLISILPMLYTGTGFFRKKKL